MSVLVENQLDSAFELVQQLEQIEANYWMKYYRNGHSLPVYSSIIAGGMACAMPELDILAMNRVIGLGVTEPVTNAELDQVIHFYQQAGSKRFFVQLPPWLVSDEVQGLLLAKDFTHHNNWTKLYRTVEPVYVTTNDELVIRKINSSESDNYGQLIFMSFDWEDTRLASWLASTVGQQGYQHYIVSWRGKDIAAGALYVEGEMASMAFAGTLELFRGKGAQSLLLQTRMQDAYDLGARFITAETAEHSEERPVNSFLNIRKKGFQVAYQRQNWIYNFSD